MRTIIWLILLFVLAVVAASALGTNDALVSFYWRGVRTDLSLNFFLLVFIGSCVALVSLIQATSRLIALPKKAHDWRAAQRERSAQAALREALAHYLGGRYIRAHKAAQQGLLIQTQTPHLAQNNEFTVLCHLLSAGSSHQLQNRNERDATIATALALAQQHPQARPAAEGAQLLAAEWALQDHNAERSLELLRALPPGVGRRTHALRLKLQASRLANQPQDALRTVRLLAKHQALSGVAAQGLVRALAFELLDSARDADQIRTQWQALENSERKDPLIAAHAVVQLASQGGAQEARTWLAPFWDQLAKLSSDERHAIALALAPAVADIEPAWLPRLEAALIQYPRQSAITFAAGCAFAQRQLWGKARLLLEQVCNAHDLNHTTKRQALRLLAELAQAQNDDAQMAAYYEKAAKLA